MYEAIAWFEKNGAIGPTERAAFETAKACRNQLAHGLLQVATEGLPDNYQEAFECLTSFVSKVERWWVLNIEVASNSDYDSSELTEEDVTPGSLIVFRLLVDIALGSGSDAGVWREMMVAQIAESHKVKAEVAQTDAQQVP